MNNSTDFILHEKLAADCLPILDFPLCKVLLMDDKNYPWLILVPQAKCKKEVIDLSPEQQHQLLVELNHACHALKNLFNPDKLNIAALGNSVPQLHIHVIGRFFSDPAWPNPVWNFVTKTRYPQEEASTIIAELRNMLQWLS